MTTSNMEGTTATSSSSKTFTSPEHRATQDDRNVWQGWCKLQSEPSIFNTILRQLEVKGVRVADVPYLDSLTEQPNRTFGLLFLFPYRDLSDDEDEDNEEVASDCSPSDLWFANQTTQNACGTVGLINILCNIPGIDRGDYIRSMMDYTKPFSPPLRGFVLSSWAFLRRLHNSFCTKADMLLADSAMKRDFNKFKQRSKSKAQAKNASKKRKAQALDEEEDSGEHHFMGYVPFNGEVWRLDGLDNKPHSLGKYEDDWISLARDNIQKYMDTARPEDQFNLTRLGPDSLITKQHELGSNIKSIQRIEERLDALDPDWRRVLSNGEEGEGSDKTAKTDEVISDTVSELGITEGLPKEAAAGGWVTEIEEAGLDDLVLLRERLGKDQGALKAKIEEGREEWESDERKAEERQFDFGPFIKGFLRKIAEKGALKEIVEEL